MEVPKSYNVVPIRGAGTEERPDQKYFLLAMGQMQLERRFFAKEQPEAQVDERSGAKDSTVTD